MAFDLYLAGVNVRETDDFLFEHGGNHLFSQLNDRRSISNWLEHLDAKGNPETRTDTKLFIDSGAYTVYTQGKELDVDEYIAYLNSIDKYTTIFAQIDKIPGVHGQPKTIEQILEAPKVSWENYLYMRERVSSPDKLLPIFHRREDFKWLKLMLETTFDGKHIPYIGIAATTDSHIDEKVEWFERVFQVIKNSSNPNVKTHAFGMTTLKVLETYPFTSADSTSWLLTGANGGIMSPWGVIYVSEVRKSQRNHLAHLDREMCKQVHDYIESFGFTIEQLMTSYKERQKLNILYLLDWAENYEYKGTGVYKKSLF